MPPEENSERVAREGVAKVAREVENTLRKSTGLLQTDYTIDAKSNLELLPDRKLPRYGSLPRRPRQLEGREMSHDVLEDSDYPRASPNVSNPISSEALVPKSGRGRRRFPRGEIARQPAGVSISLNAQGGRNRFSLNEKFNKRLYATFRIFYASTFSTSA